jgi:SAM-dependent methyltransferase
MRGMAQPDGSVDWLLTGVGKGARERQLAQWQEQANQGPGSVGDFTGDDYRRQQLERWIENHRDELTGRVLDIGVYDRRDWIGPGYQTVGLAGAEATEGEGMAPEYPGPDICADLQALPMADDTIDAILCTEVLEHTPDPFQAVREIHRVLRPGGLVLASAPMMWPDHGIPNHYHDYWRFCADGWRLLFASFAEVKLMEPAWTEDGAVLYDLLRRFEGWGLLGHVHACTGYFLEARKGGG